MKNKDCKSQRIGRNAVKLSTDYDKAIVVMNTNSCGCLHKTCTPPSSKETRKQEIGGGFIGKKERASGQERGQKRNRG